MSTRTVRLDEEAERTLDRVRTMTGLSISEVLKQGLSTYEDGLLQQAQHKPYEIFCQLDSGPGGEALASARDAKSAIAETIRRKHSC